ncbi:S-layer homology domain-containing protein [Paenibacillus sp. CC-CFT747]|nr:S-layer homology domain-containing protein [Paenibacillus sp. CC-CFT747]
MGQTGKLLPANSSLVTFTPVINSNAYTERFDYAGLGSNAIEIHFPLYTDSLKMWIDSTKLTASDFVIEDLTTSETIAVRSVEPALSPYLLEGQWQRAPLDYALMLTSETWMVKDHTYELKLSPTSSGDEIKLPAAAGSQYEAHLAVGINFDRGYIWPLGMAQLNSIKVGNNGTTNNGSYTGNPGVIVVPTPSPITKTEDGIEIRSISTLEKTYEGKNSVKVTLDNEIIKKALAQLVEVEKERQRITIFIDNTEAVANIVLPSSAIKEAAVKTPAAIIRIKYNDASYDLPIKLLNVDSIAKDLGADPKDINFTISMEKVSGSVMEDITTEAKNLGIKVLGNPIDFNITAEAYGKKFEVNNFGTTYVSRTLDLPQKVNQRKTAAVLFNPSTRTFSYVPALFTDIDGGTQVTLKRNGNSIYLVVETDKSFSDVTGHWAQDDINLLASKLIIDGISVDRFSPYADVTRAEFASMLVRALGLTPDEESAKFNDVSPTDWYAGEVETAVRTGLVQGFEDGTFRPKDKITREQMAVLVSRALKVGGQTIDTTGITSQLLAGFTDKQAISAWAEEEVAQAVKAGIIQGMNNSQFAAGYTADRAQAATMLKRLLRQLDFIN